MDNDNVIYSYTDEQAVDDGILIPVGYLGIKLMNRPIDRLTIALWADVVKDLPKNEDESLSKPALEAEIGKILVGCIKPESDMYIFKYNQKTVWAARNERNNWTLMYPSDY